MTVNLRSDNSDYTITKSSLNDLHRFRSDGQDWKTAETVTASNPFQKDIYYAIYMLIRLSYDRWHTYEQNIEEEKKE